MNVELVGGQEVFGQPGDRTLGTRYWRDMDGHDSDDQKTVYQASALSVSCTVSAGLSWAMVRTLTLRFLDLFQDVADHQQALLRLLPPGVFFL